MKNKILSTAFSFILTMALLLPIQPSLVNAGAPENAGIVSSSCITIKTKDGKQKVCDGGLQKLDVSWNSGGG